MTFDTINVANIVPAIRDICIAAYTFAGNSIWDYPEPTAVRKALPYLVVRDPEGRGSAIAGQEADSAFIVLQQQDQGDREPVWDFPIECFFPWDPNDKLKSKTTAWNAAGVLEKALQQHVTLNGTCESNKISSPKVEPWGFQRGPGPVLTFTALTFTVRAFEYLQ